MKKATKVIIGIQCRTGSTRLPNKAMKKIFGLPMIDIVIGNALTSSKYINGFEKKTGVSAQVWVLIPKGDPLKKYLEKKRYVKVFEGHPTDLVRRYSDLQKEVNADYIVRVTGDCPLLQGYLITKCINTSVRNEYDFLDNASKEYRCFFDGADVEVLSKKALKWLDDNAEEREHVCHDLRSNYDEELRYGHVFLHLDLSFFKLSVDNQKDLELVTNQYKSVVNKKRLWEEKHGKGTAHMF